MGFERLTPLDVSNLRVEQRGLPMSVAALAILDGRSLLNSPGELALDAIRTRIDRRLYLGWLAALALAVAWVLRRLLRSAA